MRSVAGTKRRGRNLPHPTARRHTRVIDAYNDLLDKTDDKPVILIVAHQSVICAIAADALGLGMEGAYHFRCMPGSLAQIDYVDGFATLSRWNG